MNIGPYISIDGWEWWKYCWRCRKHNSPVGIFRNLPHVRPGRWGFYILGLEVGSRSPDDKVGLWLKDHGLWPW